MFEDSEQQAQVEQQNKHAYHNEGNKNQISTVNYKAATQNSLELTKL